MQRKHLILLVAVASLYALALFTTPVDLAVLHKYNLSLSQVHILYFLIILPLLGIWSLAFYGFSVFDSYAKLISRHKDGAAFQSIARGLMVLVVGSAFTYLISTLFGHYTPTHLQVVKVQTVIVNYLTMLITLASFIYIYRGSVQLCRLTRKPSVPSGKLPFNIIYIGLATIFVCLFMAHLPQARAVPLTATGHAAFFVPTWLLVPTFLVPYLVTWYLGGLSIYLLGFYTRHIGGSLYSRALMYLSYGIGIVVIGSVFVQTLTIFTGQLQNLSTRSIIILIYLLLAVITAGYIPIAIGAKKLAKIETA